MNFYIKSIEMNKENIQIEEDYNICIICCKAFLCKVKNQNICSSECYYNKYNKIRIKF